MNRLLAFVSVVLLSVVLVGCASHKGAVKSATDISTTGGSGSGAYTGTSSAGVGTGSALDGSSSGASRSENLTSATIYFDFDKVEIRPEYASVIAAHGAKLAKDRSLKMRLEGNTDERGSSEYNVALGERRAQSVKRALLLQGATEAQLSTVSYGAERPVADGHSEESWSQNRRVEIVTLGTR
jgi:peptidoglycan-associated lipoprotein